jgi:hypothetical protein
MPLLVLKMMSCLKEVKVVTIKIVIMSVIVVIKILVDSVTSRSFIYFPSFKINVCEFELQVLLKHFLPKFFHLKSGCILWSGESCDPGNMVLCFLFNFLQEVHTDIYLIL